MNSFNPLPMDEETLEHSSYIGRKPCGCMVCCITLPKHVKQGGKYDKEDIKLIADWLKDGYTIDRVPDKWIREHGFEKCPVHANPPRQQKLEV